MVTQSTEHETTKEPGIEQAIRRNPASTGRSKELGEPQVTQEAIEALKRKFGRDSEHLRAMRAKYEKYLAKQYLRIEGHLHISVAFAERRYSIPTSELYVLMKHGALARIKVGHRTYLKVKECDSFFEHDCSETDPSLEEV